MRAGNSVNVFVREISVSDTRKTAGARALHINTCFEQQFSQHMSCVFSWFFFFQRHYLQNVHYCSLGSSGPRDHTP